MYHFTYWLEHFKELPPSKAQTLVKAFLQLADRTAASCVNVSTLSDCTTIAAFRRSKQVIMRAGNVTLSQAEKRAMSLFEDYLEFREYSSFKFPEEPSAQLEEYCKTMQMSYSYKAVLIREMVLANADSLSTDDLLRRIIAFYKARLDSGLPAEKSDSIFSKPRISLQVAKRVILTNPISVLVDANIITWNKKTGVVSFTSDYSPASAKARKAVCKICDNRLNKYYSSIPKEIPKLSTPQPGCSKKMQRLLVQFETEIMSIPDAATRKKLLKIHSAITAEAASSISATKDNPKAASTSKKAKQPVATEFPTEYVSLSADDPRKIGALVQYSMELLERIDYPFSRQLLKKMSSDTWSAETLKLTYPFIKRFNEKKPLAEQRIDGKGNGRYYSRVYTLGSEKYLITSEWYAKSKPLFICWYNSLKPKTAKPSTRTNTMSYTEECVKRVESSIGQTLLKRSNVAYSTSDSGKGYVVLTSKAYTERKREKYWFGYRRGPLSKIQDCKEKYLVFGCKDSNEVLVFSVDYFEAAIDRMHYSNGKDGEISHWQVEFFRDSDGHMTHYLYRPEKTEVDIDQYKI